MASTNCLQKPASQLVKEITEQMVSPKDLSSVQIDACIEYLRYEENWTITEIAEFLGYSRPGLSKKVKKIDERKSIELATKGLNKFQIATRLIGTAEFVKKKARLEKDWRLVMDTEVRMIDKLQSLGVVYERPQGDKEITVRIVMQEIEEKLMGIQPPAIDVTPDKKDDET